MPTWYRGREAVVGFLRRFPLTPERQWRVVPVGANGQVALAFYLWDDDLDAFAAHSVNVLTLDGPRIADQIAFLEPELFARFGLAAARSA